MKNKFDDCDGFHVQLKNEIGAQIGYRREEESCRQRANPRHAV
jgi:hypothetical protein